MKQGTKRIASLMCGISMLSLCLAPNVFSQDDKEDLASKARDPTASVTAFQIRYDCTASFHNVDSQNQAAVVLQPIIPFKLGEQRHIARITLPYVTDAPDFSGAAGGVNQNPVPPNYIATRETSGLADTALLDIFIFDAPFGWWGVGPVASVPTAEDRALGSGKWSLGPSAVAITKVGRAQVGLLGTWLFDVAGRDQAGYEAQRHCLT